MIIKCPKCSVAYNIPDNIVAAKPRKMHCNRCKEVFTVVKRDLNTPDGYEAFAGRPSALPGEFAYLRETPEKKPDEKIEIESEKVGPIKDKTLLGYPKSKEEEDTESEIEKPPPTPVPPEPIATEPLPPSLQDAQLKIASSAELSENIVTKVLDAEEKEQFKTEPRPHAPVEVNPAPDAVPSDPSSEADDNAEASSPDANGRSDIPNMYAVASWEEEETLNLESFAIERVTPRMQLLGKVMAGLVVLAALIVAFIIYRNSTSPTVAALPDQVSFAFSTKEREDLPNETKGLEVTVEDRRVLLRKKKGPLYVVTGSVFNNTAIKKTNIVLRGRLLDAEGETRLETHFPCNTFFKDRKLRRIPKGRVARKYRDGGKLKDCVINAESSTVYQLLFDKLPPDFDKTFTVDVKPVSASQPKR